MGCATSAANSAEGALQLPSIKTSKAGESSFHARYLLGEKLGRGNFAQVRAATRVAPTSTSDSRPSACAVKILDISGGSNGDRTQMKNAQKSAAAELSVWQTAAAGNSPYIVDLYSVFWGECCCYYVMERCESTLVAALERLPPAEVTEVTLRPRFVQMLQALNHLEKVKVVHRDVKPDNFLVSHEGVVKLADFGLATVLNDKGPLRGFCDGGTHVGTAPFMAPEMLKRRPYDTKVDIWSFGVIAYIFLFGEYPYMPPRHGEREMKQAILAGVPAPSYEVSGYRSKWVIAFVRRLLQRKPEKRASTQEALELLTISEAAPNDSWPSLMPMVQSVRLIGGGDTCPAYRRDACDARLEKEQLEHHQVHLPLQPTSAPMAILPNAVSKDATAKSKGESDSRGSTMSTATPSDCSPHEDPSVSGNSMVPPESPRVKLCL